MKDLEKKVFKLFLVFIMIGLTANIGCKKGEKEFDITDGSWGILLQTTTNSAGWVYQFVGTKESGSIFYQNIRLGTYTVSGDIVDFTTQHYDAQNNLYVYDYDGLIVDYFKMNGTFSITPPDGIVVNGIWTATR
ncbi:MAG TPA: hypothetical protein VK469_02920 [Candidatus Kapabacteria bacterium]|nr:hypothetical protein [Candidatus Kapabacteria bacterium]